MIRFLLKALFRDKNRFMISVLAVAIGVTLTVVMIGFIRGITMDTVELMSSLRFGHVRVSTKAYASHSHIRSQEYALLGTAVLKTDLEDHYPSYTWHERILSGGYIENIRQEGSQAMVGVMAIDMSDNRFSDLNQLKIPSSLICGRCPLAPNEILLPEPLCCQLGLDIGDSVSFMGTTMNGSFAFDLFSVVGIFKTGIPALDKMEMMMRIEDAKSLMDMDDAASVILGFRKRSVYVDEEATSLYQDFNERHSSEDDFGPVMLSYRAQGDNDSYYVFVEALTKTLVLLFLAVMFLVLWEESLISGIRRYHEFGIRLAIGESKGHLFLSLLGEALLIGVMGSLVGCLLGGGVVLSMSFNGIDISGLVETSVMTFPTILRAKFSCDLLYIGFLVGLSAMCIGTMLASVSIYKRQTAGLMKEME